MTRRALASVAGVAAVVVVVIVIVVVSGGSNGSDTSGSPSPGTASVPTSPLISSVATAARTSLLLPMGRLGDPANTFWELFLRSGSSSWKLATPPGVADNGGLVVAVPSAGPLTAGFLTSADLTFSPLAQSVDGGSTWSPGELPTALVGAPDALASGGAGRLLALVAHSGQTVLSSAGSLTSWAPVVSTRSLTGQVADCRPTSLTAVSFGPTGGPLLGARCAAGDRLGVLSTGPDSPAGRPVWEDAGTRTTVLRLDDTVVGTAGLGAVRSGPHAWLVAFWGPGAIGQWVQSRRLALPTGWSVLATAVGGGSGTGGAETVLLGARSERSVVQVAGPGSAWVTLPIPPAGSGAVAVVGTETDAFVVGGSRLAVWALASGATGWSRTATVTVPIQYGSSS